MFYFGAKMETTHSFDNPLKTDGFAFLEFTTNDSDQLSNYFTKLGFTNTGFIPDKNVSLYQQNEISFIVNASSDSKTRDFYEKHANSTCAMGFYVADPESAYQEALKRGATPFQQCKDSIWCDTKAIEGIGGSAIYFVDRSNKFIKKFTRTKIICSDFCLNYIDHVTHNVFRGNMDKWADFYAKIFNFRQIRYFDIDGKLTGLFSKALTSPCGKIKIPLNESKDDKSQIQEFLKEFNGEGIQHIALSSKDIYSSVAQIGNSGIKLLDTPDTYYELIDKRLPDHCEDIGRLKKFGILIDGTTTPKRKLLLQIFTENLLGPTFFEIIQRKGDEGFGEGNFQALFDSIELEQMRRGVV